MIDQNLIKYLKALGTDAGTRIHTGTAPQQSEFPLVVIRRTTGNTPRTQNGTKLFSRASVSVDVLARNYADALTVAGQIRDGLDGYVGQFDSEPAGTETTIQSCRCTAEPIDISEADGDLVLRGVSQEFLFVYLET